MTKYKTNAAADNKYAQLVEIDGKHLLLMPDGTEVPGVTLTSIHQGMDSIRDVPNKGLYKGAHAKVELFVTLASIIPE